MAESKGALIAKTVQKHAGRAKEKLLQNLGKVDRTLDDIFEEHLQNFNRQHQQATRLQKEFNNYIRCIRAVQTASKSLMEAITEVYESSWSGHDLLYVQAQSMEMLWQDFSHKLGDQVLIPINTYTNQFPEVRKKIEKRGRKLVDYDGQRHSFQNLQANAAKRRDDVKVTKGREQLEEAKRTYELLNSELHDELPALHDSRVLFYLTNLQTLFAAEQLFHTETSKVYAELEAITDKLATDCQRGSYAKKTGCPPCPCPPCPPTTAPRTTTCSVTPSPAPPALNGTASPAPASPASPPAAQGTPPPSPAPSQSATPPGSPHTPPDTPDAPPTPPDTRNNNAETQQSAAPLGAPPAETINNNLDDSVEKDSVKENDKEEKQKKKDVENESNQNKSDEVYDIPVGATLAGLPAGALYRVRATYRYTREDSDELSFDVGDVIRVVEYDDPDEQEEGWLMGIKESTNEKGMFPANFTRPI
ncbi:PREDICTED: amphiphysin [Papilio polytes]|uniref:amphiphysin n=1 Tax=Papilio polytes TaxID=76194 RepID=UPI00067695A6|nr:PREDICTED: amphiphysin [Papilio polytes]